MSGSRGRRARAILFAAAAALAVGVTGGLVTDIGPWYQGLRKPSWQPPDWLFGPAWTLIFALTALAGLLAWWSGPDASGRRRIIAAFAANAALNIGWSWLFFRAKRPDWALLEVAVLWLSIVVMIVVVRRLSAAAAWLLAPYLAWVTFAAWLNLTLVKLNPAFG